jgi:hypothetical protein
LQYSVRLVSSYTTKDGSVLRGTTQQVVTGTTSSGAPRYKIVTNRYALADIYVVGEKGTRTKIATIPLGPVDSARLTIAQGALDAIGTELGKTLVTSSTDDITTIISNTPTTVVAGGATTPAPPTPAVEQFAFVPRSYFTYTHDNPIYAVFYLVGDTLHYSQTLETILTAEEKKGGENFGEQLRRGAAKLKAGGIDVYSFGRQTYVWEINGRPVDPDKRIQHPVREFFGGALASPAAVTAPLAGDASAAQATTLYAYYTARGEALPSLAARARIYESLGLGSASLYAGTAEQNTRLLVALQGSANS